MGSLAYIGADKGVIDWGSSKPMDYGEIGALRGWLMGLTVSHSASLEACLHVYKKGTV